MYEGVPVFQTPIGPTDKPIRLMEYGEKVTAACDSTTCRFSEGGIAVEVAQARVRALPLPPRVQYATRAAKVYGDEATGPVLKRQLSAGQRVELRQVYFESPGKAGRYEIGPNEWADADTFLDHVETSTERGARQKAEAEEVKAERTRTRETAALETANRRQFAPLLRERFLDQGLDIKVSVSGSRAERLQLTYVLFTDVWSHKLNKEGQIDIYCAMGFKTIRLSDGYDWVVRYTCE
jgi:hypothetical protein